MLRFLRTVIYSTTGILGALLGISDRHHLSVFLRQMEQTSVIAHGEFGELGGNITLWGITSTGRQCAIRHGEEPNPSVFNPSKVSIANLLHHLDMQWIHVRAEQSDWKDFIYVDRYRRKHLAENKKPPVPSVLPCWRSILMDTAPLSNASVSASQRNVTGTKSSLAMCAT